MNKEQVNKIIELADTKLVAEAIGIPMNNDSGKIQIICPGHMKHTGHHDRNFGSCNLTRHGYYCFADHKATNVVKMVMEQSELNGAHMNWQDAVRFVAETCGLEEYLEESPDEYTKPTLWQEKFPFSREEMKLLGMEEYPKPDKLYMGFSNDQTNSDIIHLYRRTVINGQIHAMLQPCYVKTEIRNIFTWDDFYRTSRVSCLRVILENAKESHLKAKATYDTILSKPYLLNQMHISSDYMILLNKLKNHIKDVEKLVEKINALIKEENTSCS